LNSAAAPSQPGGELSARAEHIRVGNRRGNCSSDDGPNARNAGQPLTAIGANNGDQLTHIAMPVRQASQGHGSPCFAGFREGLNEIGYVEGRICSQHIVCCITPYDRFIDELDLPFAGWRIEDDRFVARQTVESR